MDFTTAPDLTTLPPGLAALALVLGGTQVVKLALRKGLGPRFEAPLVQAFIPFIAVGFGLLAGLAPGWLHPEPWVRIMLGLTIGFAGPWLHAVLKRRKGAES
jgi:hypothetical protein